MALTAKQLAEQFPAKGSMPLHIAQQMYKRRDEEVAALAAKDQIAPEDIIPLERMGRCMVASTLWSKCNHLAREMLLNDEHHFVRACAQH